MKPPRARLKKREILRGYQTFTRVIAEGQSLQNGAVRCFYLAVTHPRGFLRVGFSVSRSVRTSVERNRARRWMKEAYRMNRALLWNQSLPIDRAVNIVFLLRVRGGLPQRKEIREGVSQAMVTLLKELHHHLAKKHEPDP